MSDVASVWKVYTLLSCDVCFQAAAGRDRLQLTSCVSWQASPQAAFRRQGRSFFRRRQRVALGIFCAASAPTFFPMAVPTSVEYR